MSPELPLQLRVLGPVTIRGESDQETSSRITQPRQLAVLSYLALARPRGLHTRDTLVALLWPDHDETSGRQALRNALHGIRRHIGRDAVITAGDALVGLDPARVRCDAWELERGTWHAPHAASNGDHEPLRGFHVANALPFDQWLSNERARLARLIQSTRGHSSGGADAASVAPAIGASPAHNAEAYALCVRGHFLFMRSAHGGSPQELLHSRTYFDRALAIDANFAPALAGLSNFFAVAARRGLLTPFHETFAIALDYSRRTIEADPTLAVPHVHFGAYAMYVQDDFERAGREFDIAAHKDPGYAEARRFRGVWLGVQQRFDEALAEMEAAALLEPDIPQVLSSLAAARLATGDVAGAERALRDTLAIDVKHGPARDRLLRLLESQSRYAEAMQERRSAPASPSLAEFEAEWRASGNDGYRRARRAELTALVDTLEAQQVRAQATPSVGDLYAPPVLRLVASLAELGEWKKVRAWRLQACAHRPALAHWFNVLPELRAAGEPNASSSLPPAPPTS